MPSRNPKVAIIMRSYNDRSVIRQTLEMLEKQTYRDYQLWNFDSTSSDGTLEIIREFNHPDRIRLNSSKTYNPGRVLNEAISTVESEIIVFLNSDATPTDEHWLQNLIRPLDDPGIGAVYGRQVARQDCRSLFIKDTERAFGDGSEAARWVHFFSMANSAARRSVLARYPFETKIQYSEDIEWSYRLRLDGYRIHYVAQAAAMHSHNYSLKQSYRRHFGEGTADAWIFRRGEIDQRWPRTFLLPFMMEIIRDVYWALSKRSLDAVVHTVPLRFVQKWARWRGIKHGQLALAGV
jgi:rhamnosyltransferase